MNGSINVWWETKPDVAWSTWRVVRRDCWSLFCDRSIARRTPKRSIDSMTQSTSSNAVSTHTDATTTKHLAQKSNLGQFTLLSFFFHCLCDVTTWTRLFPVFKLCCRKAHLKETQGRIMDLNDKIAVVTQTLQQALGGLQSKIEEDTRKVIQTFRNQTSLLCTVT